MKSSFLLIPLFFFFLIFSISVNAYTLFSQNPSFDSNINYTLVYSSAYLNQPNFTWSSSCYGLSGCLNITTNNFTNIQLELSNDNSFLFTTNNSGLSPTNEQFLPKNEEGIVILKYHSTQDFYGYEGVVAQPKLFVVQKQPYYTVLNVTDVNPSNDTWFNYTIFVPPVSYDRNITVDFGFSSYQPPTEFDIDKFKFYTYDIIENRESLDTNITVERNRYCSDTSHENNPNAEWSQEYFYQTQNGNTYYFCNDTQEGFYVGFFDINNVVFARRELQEFTNNSEFGSNFIGVIQFRDFYALRNYVWNVANPSTLITLVDKLNLNSINFVNLWNTNYSGYPTQIYTNGVPMTVYNLSNSSLSGVFNQNTFMFTDSELLPYSNNSLPTGTTWKYAINYSGDTYFIGNNFSFFDNSNFLTNACTPHFECSNITDNESYVNADCSRTQQTYCGVCGCGETRCQNITLLSGTFCDVNDLTGKKFYTYMTSGCSNYLINGSCGTNQLCVFHSSSGSNTIECFNNATGQHDFCINSTGGYDVNCTGTTLPTLCKTDGNWTDCTNEPINLDIIWLQNYIGMTGSFIISLVISFIISMLILFKSKRNGFPGFMVSMLISLGGFTYLGMFPQWFFVLAMSIIILGIYWAYKGGR